MMLDAEQDAVTREIEIAAPPERVFRALTDAKQLFTWWGSEPTVDLTVFNMDARKGGKYEYRCKPKQGADFGEVGENLKNSGSGEFICHGEVLEYDPPRLLVWSWMANWHEHPDTPTVVRWELTPTRNGTLVRVTHSGLGQEPVSRKDYGQGWVGVLGLLKNYLQKKAG
jgi:uncharacterized protein YndB with AHSA1/START domain